MAKVKRDDLKKAKPPLVKKAVNGSKVRPILPHEHAGKWVAWSADGLTIVAVASSFEDAEKKAALAGYKQIAIDRVPAHRRAIGIPR